MAEAHSMSSVRSYYTAQSSFYSAAELSPFINLNGKSYHLTVYHKKTGSEWEEITHSYLEQSKDINLQEMLQKHIKLSHKDIEITTSVDLKEGFICKAKDTDGIMRKVAGFSLTESQHSKIFAVLKKIKTPKYMVNSSSLLDSSFIKISLEEVKAERVNDYLKQVNVNNKPVGFKNKLNNCGFNSCLQMIINEPALLHIYTTVASHYAKSTKAKDQECGNRMLSVLDSYDQAIEEQKSIPEEVSNKLRLAMNYLSPKEIKLDHYIQEDASEILTILFAKNDEILKKQNLTNTSSINYKFEKVTHHLKVLTETPNKDCSFLNPDNIYREEGTSYGISINFDSEQKDFTLRSLLKKYFCNKDVIGSEMRRYMVDGNDTWVSPVKEEIEFSTLPKDLFINFARFKPDWTKLTNPIEIPEQLDAKLLKIKNAPSGSYELSSFIVHLGDSLNNGHYMAYRKVQDQWMQCNDGSVSLVSKKQALEDAKDSYICFYRLKTSVLGFSQ
ncbi:Ubiquitin carboxyl-terminal hydrolase [Candidatus Rhabdochlamydia oedothoracis]|uniref:Ubiquitin carboxyl-terminal hydrolase n=2 Tax=Candidatus Rhabdochlamydiaceae TaxID=689704 RepID=A0ABX8V0J0_9BACT|nr:hypothetical protein RHOW815_000245 [Candidatus Rhabdochlamydia sp. W815]QYF48737.1 Ubiquitin carboxyl-terminal hydrolase [Candidatus Rhabdochlamydia oedothoracis]